jgi:hypothetical protein
VPYDIWLTRERSFEKMTDPAKRPIEPASLAFALDDQPPGSRRRDDETWWITRPDTGEPWFVCRYERGNVVLSCSYTNPRFLANFADLLDFAVSLGDRLRARAFEEVGGREVTRRSVERLADARGGYAKLQFDTFVAVLGQMEADATAPLEWPIGPIDMVSEYCALLLSGEGRFESVDAVLEAWSGPVEVVDLTSAVLMSEHKGQMVTAAKVLVRPDGAIQVWPSHQRIPFAVGATVAVELTRSLVGRYDLAARLGVHPVDPPLLEEILERASGLGVDFYEWTARLGQP